MRVRALISFSSGELQNYINGMVQAGDVFEIPDQIGKKWLEASSKLIERLPDLEDNSDLSEMFSSLEDLDNLPLDMESDDMGIESGDAIRPPSKVLEVVRNPSRVISASSSPAKGRKTKVKR